MSKKVVLEAEVKSNIGEVSKDASGLVGEFQVMGVSLNGVKKAFVAVGRSAKASFATIKAGIASSGIGALVVAVASLASYFTNTKRGSDALGKGLAGLSSGFSVLVDRISKFGEGLMMMFNPMTMRKGAKMMADAFKGIGAEIVADVSAMTLLQEKMNQLRDAEMEFQVQKALTRKEIEKARLIAEDETKSAAERLENLKLALELEEETTKKELEMAQQRVDMQIEEMKLSENMVEDEQKLADLKVELIQKETASIKMRRRVITEVNALENEIAAEEAARAKIKQDAIDAEKAKLQELIDLETDRINNLTTTAAEVLDEFYQSQLSAQQQELNAIEDKYFAIIEGKKANNESVVELEEAKNKEISDINKKYGKQQVKWSEMTEKEKVGIASSTAGDMATILGEETAAGKAFAITQATIDTYASANAAYKSMSGIAVVGPALGAVAAAAAIVAGFKNVQAIQATGGGKGGGGRSRSGGGGGTVATPAPQMMSGAFDLTGGIEPEPMKAYVLTDEMTNSQNQLANIRRRSTI